MAVYEYDGVLAVSAVLAATRRRVLAMWLRDWRTNAAACAALRAQRGELVERLAHFDQCGLSRVGKSDQLAFLAKTANVNCPFLLGSGNYVESIFLITYF